jgi:NitT/TauT family transport system substrate-binding protein
VKRAVLANQLVKRTALPVSAAVLLLPLTACGGSAETGDGKNVTITVGYQSKTINTVNALNDGHRPEPPPSTRPARSG